MLCLTWRNFGIYYTEETNQTHSIAVVLQKICITDCTWWYMQCYFFVSIHSKLVMYCMLQWEQEERLLELPLLLHMHTYNAEFLQFWVLIVFCVMCTISRFSIKVKLYVPLLCICALHCLERPSPKWPILCRVGC